MKYLGPLALAIVIVFIVVSVYVAETSYKTTRLFMGGREFAAEISDTPLLQERGLSYRPDIADDYAMIFVFSAPGNHPFWMKDMNFPIDIIWLSSDKKIIYIEKSLSPSTYPKSFGPQADSLYVVEAAPGTADKLGLAPGQTVSFSL